MAQENQNSTVSRRLIELSRDAPPVHSYNRQLVRLILEATGAVAATLWLVQKNELVRCEEIEEEVGALKRLSIGDRTQEDALRDAYENGNSSILVDKSQGFNPMAPSDDECRRVAFFPIHGIKKILGVIRLVFPVDPDSRWRERVSLARSLAGYYALYEAQRVLSVQHQERRDIDRLNKSILELQHYVFSPDLGNVLVNSAMEIAPVDRVVLLEADDDSPSVKAVSGVLEQEKKGAWSKLVCELGELVLDQEGPVKFFAHSDEGPEVQDEEIRSELDSYALMTDVKSMFLYPLVSGGQKTGVLIYESFSDQSPSAFEQVLLTIYASHAASAMGNHRLFESVPLSGFYARNIHEETEDVKRGPFRFGKFFKTASVIVLLAMILWFGFFYQVPEKVGAQCFVAPLKSRTVTAKVSGNTREIHFDQGHVVKEGDPLIQFETRDFRLSLRRSQEKAANLRTRIAKLRGEAEEGMRGKSGGQKLGELKALEFELGAQKAQTELLENELDRCLLKAPISGTILDPQEPDEMVGATVKKGEPLCKIGEISQRVKVKVAIPSERVSDIREGYDVLINLRSLIEMPTIEGEIEEIGIRSVTHEESNVFMGDVIVPRAVKAKNNPDQKLRLQPGMTGKARVVLPGTSTYASIYGRRLYRKINYWLF